MKKFNVKGFLFFTLVLVIGLLIGYEAREFTLTKENTNLASQQEAPKETYEYLLMARNDYVVVYLPDAKTIFEYTDIPLSTLPQDVKAQLTTGLPMKDEAELYDFLESYTS